MREGRFGPYVNWGKVNATIPKSTPPDAVTLTDAIELLAEREGRPAPTARKAPGRPPRRRVTKKTAKPTGKPTPKPAAKVAEVKSATKKR